ncbi:MAG: PepSY domain-containing protein [Hyphomicrobiales bacterium]
MKAMFSSASLALAIASASLLPVGAEAVRADEHGRHRVYEYPPRAYSYAPPRHHAGQYGYGPVSRADIPALLAGHGFTRIHDIDKDDGVYEVEARHVSGRKAEIEIDIATGRIIEIDWD